MQKYVVGAFIIIFIIIGAYYFLKTKGPGAANPGQTGATALQVATSTYATSTFSIVYPSDYTVDAAFKNDQVNPKKPISGVKFTIPGEMATGTNLAGDTFLSVEWLPRAKHCSGDIYLAENVRAQTVTEGGVEYSVATSSGAGAGNFYEEQVYARTGSSPCTAVRYLIHSFNIGNYEPGVVREFDRQALLAAFDAIRQSLVLPSTTP